MEIGIEKYAMRIISKKKKEKSLITKRIEQPYQDPKRKRKFQLPGSIRSWSH